MRKHYPIGWCFFLCGKMWEMAIAAAVAIMRISIGCNAFIFWYVGNAMLLHHAL